MKILQYPDDVLREYAAPVTAFDASLSKRAYMLMQAMLNANGIGIAAPQIGVLEQLIVIYDTRLRTCRVMVNPEIVHFSEEKSDMEEGCLSFGQKRFKVTRSNTLTVRYQDLFGKSKMEILTGLTARVTAHEIDHLFGRLLVDVGEEVE